MPDLERFVHHVDAVEIGETTRYRRQRLVVGRDDVTDAFADPALATVRPHAASPGDRVRIVKPLDVVEPRSRGPEGGTFPGWLVPVNRPRGGRTHVLRGAAVLAAGFLPRNQEGLVDMSGPAAELSPFARTHNVVVEFDPASGASWADVDAA
ncbi:MAG: grdE, partial [Cryptosporangiaceae bacterium]|nr:grdE [Cryptosporangiaceae bacterium]